MNVFLRSAACFSNCHAGHSGVKQIGTVNHSCDCDPCGCGGVVSGKMACLTRRTAGQAVPASKYECAQCQLTGKRALCASCAQTCHHDHAGLVYVGQRTFTCDCATHSKCINNNPVGGGGGAAVGMLAVAPPGARLVAVAPQAQPMFVQQPQYVMQQRLVTQNGVTFLQTVAVPVQMAQPVMMQQPMMMAQPVMQPAMSVAPQQPIMMSQQPMMQPAMSVAPQQPMMMSQQPMMQPMSQQPMQMAYPAAAAPAVQMSYPPAGVQMAKPVAGVQMSKPPAGVQMSQPPTGVQMAQPVGAVMAQPQQAKHSVHLAQKQAAAPEVSRGAPLAHTSSVDAVRRSRAPASPASTASPPLLQHAPSAPMMTMVDEQFDALKSRPAPRNEYGSLTLLEQQHAAAAAKSAATQSHYGAAPPLAPTYDRVESSESIYTKAPLPQTIELESDDGAPPNYESVAPLTALDDDLPNAPTHEPAANGKVKISQSRVYA